MRYAEWRICFLFRPQKNNNISPTYVTSTKEETNARNDGFDGSDRR